MEARAEIRRFIAHIKNAAKKDIKLEDWQKPYAEAYLRKKRRKS